MSARVFLTAEWRHLLMLNYSIDPAILRPLCPPGVELDEHLGKNFISVVGFQFLNCHVLGLPIPFHRNFEEVNLRFYVRRRSAEGWRRGVVFVRELVPRRAIAFVARTLYGEPYSALPMKHRIENDGGMLRLQYNWQRRGRWEFIEAGAIGRPREIGSGSEEEFITEHYWGYTARPFGCSEYQVEHPRWRVWSATEARLEADVASLYGDQFVEPLAAKPSSTFIAEGSFVTVRRHAAIPVHSQLAQAGALDGDKSGQMIR